MDEPDDSLGEVEGLIFNVQLSKAAKGFLEAERFFETPQFPEDEVTASDDSDDDWYDAPSLEDEQ